MSAQPVARVVPSPLTDYNRWRQYRELRLMDGTWQPFIDPTEVIAHVAKLRAQGLSVQAICELSGVSQSTMAPLAWVEHSAARVKVRPETAARILAVRFDLALIEPGRHVPALGTQRRIKAMCAMGWTMEWIAGRLGVSVAMVSRTALVAEAVTAARAREIAALYNEVSVLSGPSEIVRRSAKRKRWAPPAAWDDIDDPDERPKGLGWPPNPDGTPKRRKSVGSV